MTSESHYPRTRTYCAVFIGLIVLTALTVGVGMIDLGGLNDSLALAIAAGKAALIALFFMHVRRGSRLVKATIVAGCLWLLILMGLTSCDFLTRNW